MIATSNLLLVIHRIINLGAKNGPVGWNGLKAPISIAPFLLYTIFQYERGEGREGGSDPLIICCRAIQ